MRHIKFAPSIVAINYFRRSHEVVIRIFEYFFWKITQKIKNSSIFPLMLSKCLIIHKKIYRISITIVRCHPIGKLWGSEWELRPISRTKTKGDVVRKSIMLQKQFNVFGSYWFINKCWAFPTQNMISSFSQNTFIAHFLSHLSY